MRANPEGHRYTVDNAYLAGEAGALIPALAPAFTELPTAKSFSLWFDLAHLPARPLPDMALSVQSDLYFATYVVGEEPAQDDLCRSWTDDTMRRLEPFSAGCYLGDSDLTDPARPVHERRRLGPLPPSPRGPRPRPALRRLRLPG